MEILRDDFLGSIVGGAKLYCYVYSLTDGEISNLTECGYRILKVRNICTDSLEDLYVVTDLVKREKVSNESVKEFNFISKEKLEYFCKSQFISDF